MSRNKALVLLLLTVIGCTGDSQKGDTGKNPTPIAQKGGDQKTKREPDLSLTSLEMAKELIANDKAAEAKFKDKTIEVTGEVSSVGGKRSFSFKGMKRNDKELLAVEVRCELAAENDGKASRLSKGQKVKAVGKFFGVSLGTYLTLVDCTLVELEPSKVLTMSAMELAAEFERDKVAAAEKFEKKDIIVSGVFEGLFPDGPGNDVQLTGNAKVKIAVAVGGVYDRELDSIKKGQAIEMRGTCTGLFLDNAIILNSGFLVNKK